MFEIETRIGPSSIHGTGVFATEVVFPGETVWRFHPNFDMIISEDSLASLPRAALAYIEKYAYRSLDIGGRIVLSGDHAKFLNHSDDPNTEEQPFVSIARRRIDPGDEITCDYGAFCSDWDGFESALNEATASAPTSPSLAANLPHSNLYTRLQPSSHGVGVFAIRDIPAGTLLFKGDAGETVRVSPAELNAIDDAEVRRMYLDFCPLVDGYLIAPGDLNKLTMGWYVNHSDNPNLSADGHTSFSARRPIAAAEELTVDYTSYTDHAAAFSVKQK